MAGGGAPPSSGQSLLSCQQVCVRRQVPLLRSPCSSPALVTALQKQRPKQGQVCRVSRGPLDGERSQLGGDGVAPRWTVWTEEEARQPRARLLRIKPAQGRANSGGTSAWVRGGD